MGNGVIFALFRECFSVHMPACLADRNAFTALYC